MEATSPHSDAGLKSVLKFNLAYNFFMKIVGYDKAMQELSNAHIKAFPNSHILDIGCGTGLILNHLPEGIRYLGIDQNDKYIEKNQKIFQEKEDINFKCLPAARIQDLGSVNFDVCLAISLLHHLTDADARGLIDFAYQALKPGGRLVTYDPIYTPNQIPFEVLFNKLDRGKNIRTKDRYLELNQVFPNCESFVRRDMGWNIPATVFIMELTK